MNLMEGQVLEVTLRNGEHACIAHGFDGTDITISDALNQRGKFVKIIGADGRAYLFARDQIVSIVPLTRMEQLR